MLKHCMRGLVESAVITHKPSGSRAILTVTTERGGHEPKYTVSLQADHAFEASHFDGWTRLECRGAQLMYKAERMPHSLYPGMPTLFIEAPYALFKVQFFIDVTHPDYPEDRRPRREDSRRART